ncbi:MAG: hypothetical protein ACNA7U_05240 [Candidatus Izemoplasmataceae bacterium]
MMHTLTQSCKSKQSYQIDWQVKGFGLNKKIIETIDHKTINPDLKVINVMSNSKHVNVTGLALSLARSYANAGFDTLLLEVNFRNPVFQTYFNLSPNAGISYWIKDDIFPILPHQENLDILASGAPMENVSAFLISKAFKEMLFNLKGLYDKIVIDTPTLSEHLDALIISDYACGNITIQD